MMRVKLVMSITSDGASVSSVITNTIWMAVLRFWRSLPLPICKFTNGVAIEGTEGGLGAAGAAGAKGALGAWGGAV